MPKIVVHVVGRGSTVGRGRHRDVEAGSRGQRGFEVGPRFEAEVGVVSGVDQLCHTVDRCDLRRLREPVNGRSGGAVRKIRAEPAEVERPWRAGERLVHVVREHNRVLLAHWPARDLLELGLSPQRQHLREVAAVHRDHRPLQYAGSAQTAISADGNSPRVLRPFALQRPGDDRIRRVDDVLADVIRIGHRALPRVIRAQNGHLSRPRHRCRGGVPIGHCSRPHPQRSIRQVQRLLGRVGQIDLGRDVDPSTREPKALQQETDCVVGAGIPTRVDAQPVTDQHDASPRTTLSFGSRRDDPSSGALRNSNRNAARLLLAASPPGGTVASGSTTGAGSAVGKRGSTIIRSPMVSAGTRALR